MKTTVKKFKFFSAHEDEAQEAWLQDMGKQGLHFTGFDRVGRFTFARGEPAHMAYRIDYIDRWKTDDYSRLFEDAGWERVADLFGWFYWRKPVADGVVPEIYTDPQSKIAKLQRMLVTIAAIAAVFVFLALPYDDVPMYLVIALVVFVPFNTYQSYLLLKRIRELRNPA